MTQMFTNNGPTACRNITMEKYVAQVFINVCVQWCFIA